MLLLYVTKNEWFILTKYMYCHPQAAGWQKKGEELELETSDGEEGGSGTKRDGGDASEKPAKKARASGHR